MLINEVATRVSYTVKTAVLPSSQRCSPGDNSCYPIDDCCSLGDNSCYQIDNRCSPNDWRYRSQNYCLDFCNYYFMLYCKILRAN